jgi:hypothetical protein
MHDAEIIKVAFDRFIERLGILGNLVFCDRIGHLSNDIVVIDVIPVSLNRILVSMVSKETIWQPLYIENLCVEIFHTRNIKVLDYKM